MKIRTLLISSAIFISIIATIGGLMYGRYVFINFVPEDFNWIRYYLVTLTGVVLFVVGVFYFIANQISKPIKEISNDVNEITQGKLDIQLEKSNIYEIQKLIDALNRILASLKLAIMRTGATKGELGLGEAIKAKEKAEKELETAKERAEKYLDLSGVMIVALDNRGKVTLINKKGCEILEYKNSNEIIGKNWFDNFIPKKNVVEVKNVFNQIMKGKIKLVEHYENPVLTKRGKERIISWYNTLLKDEKGNIARILSSGADITKKKNLENELTRIKYAVESSNDAIGMSTPDGHHFYQNKAFNSLFGYNSAEELEKEGGGPAVYVDKKIGKEVFSKIMSGKSWVGELKMRNKKGRIFDVALRADAIKDKTGKIIGLIGIHREVKKSHSNEKSEKKYFLKKK